jgi:hypothetical protein
MENASGREVCSLLPHHQSINQEEHSSGRSNQRDGLSCQEHSNTPERWQFCSSDCCWHTISQAITELVTMSSVQQLSLPKNAGGGSITRRVIQNTDNDPQPTVSQEYEPFLFPPLASKNHKTLSSGPLWTGPNNCMGPSSHGDTLLHYIVNRVI